MHLSLRFLLSCLLPLATAAGCFPVKWKQLIAPEMKGRVTRDGQPLADVAVHLGGTGDAGGCLGGPFARSSADGTFSAPKQMRQHNWIVFGDYFGAHSLCFQPGDGSGSSVWRFTKRATPPSLAFDCRLAADGGKLATVTDADAREGAVGCVVQTPADGS